MSMRSVTVPVFMQQQWTNKKDLADDGRLQDGWCEEMLIALIPVISE